METLVLAADLGNYDLKYWDGNGKPKAIRSTKFKIPNGRKALKSDNLNPLVELNGERFHFGHRAYLYRSQSHTVETEKANEALLNLLACVEPVATEFKLHVHTSHPSDEQFEKSITKQLVGTHYFKRNGKEAVVTIESVAVEPEGLGAWKHSKNLGLVPEMGLSVVLDIGGGTWLSRLLSPDGEIIESTVSERGGAYDLAVNIASDDRLKDAVQDQPDPAVVMDGFASGSHYYAANASASWRPWLNEYLEPWFKGIFGKVSNQYKRYLPQITRILVTGGSAHLVEDKLKGLSPFLVIPEPRFSNVRGLLPTAKAGVRV